MYLSSVEIKKRILPLSDKMRVLFAVLICERLYPNYVFFQERENWGDKDSLQNGIVTIYQWLVGDCPPVAEDIVNVISEIELVTPDTGDFSEVTVSFALDASASILETLDYILDKDVKHIIAVDNSVVETVDGYVRSILEMQHVDAEGELRIQKHPVTLSLIDGRDKLLRQLSVLDPKTLTKEQIEPLRDRRPIIDLNALFE